MLESRSDVSKLFESVHEFSALFFVRNPSFTVQQKKLALQEAIKQACLQLEQFEPPLTKAELLLATGRFLNISPDFDPLCEEQLNRCVKLNPNSIEGRNELGECLWKKGDIEHAKTCFENALSKERNVVSLRNLSLVYRQSSDSKPDVQRKNVLKSYELAKEALDLQPGDGQSLYNYANACLALFFSTFQRKTELIGEALVAYEKASEHPSEKFNPDLHFNRAAACRYQEQYQLCLDSYVEALRLEPGYTQAKEKKLQLECYLSRLAEMVARKGKLKPKRLEELSKSICRQYELGPHAIGKQKPLTYKKFEEVNLGSNKGAVVLGKVVGLVLNEETIPYTFCMIDDTMHCCAVSVYNFSDKFGLVIGQAVAIPEPYVVDCKLTIAGKDVAFRSFSVPSPEILIVNSKTMGAENVAFAELDLKSAID